MKDRIKIVDNKLNSLNSSENESTNIDVITLTPIKAIRAHCSECSNQQPKEVRLCTMDDCPLYSYRFGKNSNRAGIGNKKNLIH